MDEIQERIPEKELEDIPEIIPEKSPDKGNNKSGPQTFVTDGYEFAMKKDADMAKRERKKAEYLQQHIDYSQPASVLRIYEKAVKERLFRTPVGIAFLRELQMFLMESPEIDNNSIPPISLYTSFSGSLRDHSSPARNRIEPSAGKTSSALPVSIIINIALVIAIIAMFVITLSSDQPNVLNYENVITNRYASWEQQLKEREQAVREKERELKLEID